MSRAPNLNALPYFDAVARRGSLSRAAEEMSVSPSAVSQQIKLLEQQLGVKLFRRDGRKLSLTLEGEQLAHSTGAALRILLEAQAQLRRTRVARQLHLRVSPSFGVRWLGPRLSNFLARYPDWYLSVDAAPDPTDFDREVMDLDIRYGSGQWPGLHRQPLVNDHVLPLASPGYLAQLDPDAPLVHAQLIDSSRALCQWEFWMWHMGMTVQPNRSTIRMDRSSMALQLALDGTGVVLESLALAAAELAEGKLVPVLPAMPVLRFPAYWALCPERFVARRPVRLFLEWVQEQALGHRDDVEKLIADLGMTISDVVPR